MTQRAAHAAARARFLRNHDTTRPDPRQHTDSIDTPTARTRPGVNANR